MLKRQLNNPHLLQYLTCQWVKRLLGYAVSIDVDFINPEVLTYLRGQPTSISASKLTKKALVALLSIDDRHPKTTKVFSDNCTFIRKLLNLPRGADKLIQFALLCQANPWFQSVVNMLDIQDSYTGLNSILLDMTGLKVSDFNAISESLIQFGLLKDKDFGVIDGSELPQPMLLNLLTNKLHSREQLIEPLLQPSEKAQFALDDFPQVNTALLGDYLSSAMRKAQVGTSVLLHGISGSGKTELARSLAKHCDCKLYEVRSTGMVKQNPDEALDSRYPCKDRLRHLSLLNTLLSAPSNAVLLIDECEHLFELADNHYSKEYLQQFIEHNAIPCIWITNHVQCLEPSFIRRFKLVTEVPSPRPKDIQHVCKRHFKGLGLSERFKRNITRIDNVSPALIANASHVAKTLNVARIDAENTIHDVIESTLHASGLWDSKAQYQGELDFDASLLNLKQPASYLDEVSFALKHNKPARVLLSGPPGTGKTAFAHFLTETNQRDLIRVKCSDVLSKWVGESEQNVAELFHRAHVEEKVILLDEVDSLLVSREALTAHHELQLVNEFLTQIECFTQPLFAATNFDSRLDKAVLRRFDFKLECTYLKPEQVCALYRQVLGIKRLSLAEQQRLFTLKHLTPGDFAILARRKQFRPKQNHRLSAITLLAEENQRKQPQTPMGFIRPH